MKAYNFNVERNGIVVRIIITADTSVDAHKLLTKFMYVPNEFNGVCIGEFVEDVIKLNLYDTGEPIKK